MLLIDDVHKSFAAVAAVRGVSLSFARGQIVGLLGPNGAGKTTLIRMITGFIPPDRGRVVVDRFDTVEQSRQARALVGYLPESTPLYPEMKTREYLDYRGRLFGMPRSGRRAGVDRVLERCWLRDVESRPVGTLSKGYRQRVGLAASLLHDPPVLVLDEPTNGLDPTQIRETRRLVSELAGDRTMIISSHILAEIEQACNRVVVLVSGQVVADGAPTELIARSVRRAAYVAEARAEPAELERRLAAIPHARVQMVPADGDGWSAARVSVQDGGAYNPALGEEIGRALLGVPVRLLRPDSPSLESFVLGLIDSARGQKPERSP